MKKLDRNKTSVLILTLIKYQNGKWDSIRYRSNPFHDEYIRKWNRFWNSGYQTHILGSFRLRKIYEQVKVALKGVEMHFRRLDMLRNIKWIERSKFHLNQFRIQKNWSDEKGINDQFRLIELRWFSGGEVMQSF